MYIHKPERSAAGKAEYGLTSETPLRVILRLPWILDLPLSRKDDERCVCEAVNLLGRVRNSRTQSDTLSPQKYLPPS